MRLRDLVLTSAVVVTGVTFAYADGAVAPTPFSLTSFTTYTENFDTLANTGTSTTVPAGWGFSEVGSAAAANGIYTAGTGGSGTGDVYSFGSTGSTDRAFGTVLSGTNTPTLFAAFTNNTGQTISTFTITYTGEQWRLGQANRGADRLDFAFSTDATGVTGGTYTDVDALDFNSPITTGTAGALDGNLPANQASVTGTFTANLASGQTMYIRYSDFNVTGSDDGLGIDNFSMSYQSFQPVPAPPAAVSLGIGGLVGLMGTGVKTLRARKQAKRKEAAK